MALLSLTRLPRGLLAGLIAASLSPPLLASDPLDNQPASAFTVAKNAEV